MMSRKSGWRYLIAGNLCIMPRSVAIARLSHPNPHANPHPNPNPHPHPNPKPHPDQVHTTGMDIKQAASARAALTLGKDMSFRDYAQGAYRMRGIGKGQTVELLRLGLGLGSDPSPNPSPNLN